MLASSPILRLFSVVRLYTAVRAHSLQHSNTQLLLYSADSNKFYSFRRILNKTCNSFHLVCNSLIAIVQMPIQFQFTLYSWHSDSAYGYTARWYNCFFFFLHFACENKKRKNLNHSTKFDGNLIVTFNDWHYYPNSYEAKIPTRLSSNFRLKICLVSASLELSLSNKLNNIHIQRRSIAFGEAFQFLLFQLIQMPELKLKSNEKKNLRVKVAEDNRKPWILLNIELHIFIAYGMLRIEFGDNGQAKFVEANCAFLLHCRT